MRRLLLATSGVVVIISTNQAAAQPAGGAQPESLKSVVVGLANAGVPAGIVAAEDAVHRGDGTSGFSSKEPEALRPVLRARVAALAVPLSTELVGGVWHLKAEDAPAALLARLNRSTRLTADVDGTVASVLYRVVSQALLQRDIGGVLGTGLFSNACRLDQPIRMKVGEYSVEALLDEVVKQAPGLVWFVSYPGPARATEASNRLTFGIVCPGGENVKVTLSDLP